MLRPGLARRIAVAGAVAGPLAMMMMVVFHPSPAKGGEYHKGTQLICSDCHTMHFSMQHDYSGGAAPTLGSGGPFGKLLKDSSTNICKSCHDGQTFAPDVIGANTGSHVRSAGALTTGASPYEDYKGHTMGYTGTAPGGTTAVTSFSCANCHQPHGNTSYRNLNTAVTYALGTNDTTKDVFVRGWTLGSVSTNYADSNVDFNEPTSTASAMGTFCKSCHTNFHGASTDTNMKASGSWIRHPTADANITSTLLTQFQNKLYRVKVMSPTGQWGTQGTAWTTAPSDTTPTCQSCHRAHGNKNPFGLVFASGTAAINEEGDGTGMRTLCGQCHTQGN